LKSVVLDPVMVATSGAVLIDNPAIAVLVRELFGRVMVVTPNLDEASLLVGRPLADELAMEDAAREMIRMGAKAVLLKGGHLAGDVVCDLMLTNDGQIHWMRAPRIATSNTHGTGCTLSSAMAAYLALGRPLLDAVMGARDYVRAALVAGSGARTGAGGGPLNHGHAPHAMQLRPLR
jgi:hydroxymethylpyrimidine/phosphomethylpyrimidine kinase